MFVRVQTVDAMHLLRDEILTGILTQAFERVCAAAPTVQPPIAAHHGSGMGMCACYGECEHGVYVCLSASHPPMPEA